MAALRIVDMARPRPGAEVGPTNDAPVAILNFETYTWGLNWRAKYWYSQKRATNLALLECRLARDVNCALLRVPRAYGSSGQDFASGEVPFVFDQWRGEVRAFCHVHVASGFIPG
jgi:hypothetical protein